MSGICAWNTGLPKLSANGREYAVWRVSRLRSKASSGGAPECSTGSEAGVSTPPMPVSGGNDVPE